VTVAAPPNVREHPETGPVRELVLMKEEDEPTQPLTPTVPNLNEQCHVTPRLFALRRILSASIEAVNSLTFREFKTNDNPRPPHPFGQFPSP
jgi:hypothetical protein